MTTETTTTSKRPTHRVYAVSRRRDSDKGYWNDIGAAWAHADGKGFSVKLDFLPLNGADLVIRVPEDKTEARQGGEA
jgi:hypothetical protein